MQYVEIPIGRLIPDPTNARTHSDKNLSVIKASLKRFGQQKPIVVSPDLVVVAGNGTLEAAKALKWETLQCVETHLKGAEARAYAIADNRSGELASWDEEILRDSLKAFESEEEELLLSAGFSSEELDELVRGCPEDEISHDGTGDEWYTPPHIVTAVRTALGGEIGLDPCAAIGSPVEASKQYHSTLGDNGLLLPWDSPQIYCNPPYSDVGPWFEKGVEAAGAGSTVIFLVPMRPESRNWQRFIWANDVRVLIPTGRIRFLGTDGQIHGSGMLVTAFVVMGPKVGEVGEALRAALGDGWLLRGV